MYSTCAKEDLKRIHKKQKQIGRTILDIRKTKEIRSTELFKKLDWIPIDERANLLTAAWIDV